MAGEPGNRERITGEELAGQRQYGCASAPAATMIRPSSGQLAGPGQAWAR